jgi:hypothetical protein
MYRKSKHILCPVTSSRKSCRLRNNLENSCRTNRPQMAIRCMPIACWMHKATNTHSEYLIFIAVPLQQQLHESSSMLRNTSTACLVIWWKYLSDSPGPTQPSVQWVPGLSRGYRRPGRDADPSPLLVLRLRKSWAIPPLALWVLLGLLRCSLYLYLYLLRFPLRRWNNFISQSK